MTTRHDHVIEHQLVLAAGATAIDATTAMIFIPPSATLVGHRIGADICLAFREA